MEKGWQNKANEYTQAKGRRKRWQKVLTVLSAIVVFCTTYALILPAITMEDTVYCGYEEKHTDECYAEVRTLVCGLAEDEGHSHTEDCYAWEKVLVCGIAETEGHAHTEACYQVKKTLTCTETDEQHVHDESCYTEEKETGDGYFCRRIRWKRHMKQKSRNR